MACENPTVWGDMISRYTETGERRRAEAIRFEGTS